jgi:hypothetical protein
VKLLLEEQISTDKNESDDLPDALRGDKQIEKLQKQAEQIIK